MRNTRIAQRTYSPVKRIVCMLLSMIIAFGTFVALTVDNFMLSDIIDLRSIITAKAADTNDKFYRYGDLVGIYTLDYTNSSGLQYKIGDDGTWKDYVRPFAIDPFTTTKVYKRQGANGTVTYTNYSVDTLAMGTYTQSESDIELSNHDATFAYTRTYDSRSKSWFESVDSRLYKTNEGIIRLFQLDGSDIRLVRTSATQYTDQVTGNKLVYDSSTGKYSYTDGDITYKYRTGSSTTTFYICAVEDRNGNAVTITRNSSRISVSNGVDTFTVPYVTASNTADTMHTVYITDPNGNRITYDVKDAVFYHIVDQSGVVINDYDYRTNGDGTLTLTSTIDRTIDYYTSRLKKVTNIDGSYTTYGYNNAERRVRVTDSGCNSTYTYYDRAFQPVRYIDEYGDETLYTYNSKYLLTREECDGEVTTYTYSGYKPATSTTRDEDDNIISSTTYANGLPVVERDEDAYSYYTYDSNGNMLVSADLKADYQGTPPTAYDPSLDCFDVTTYTYHADGALATETYSNGEYNEYTCDSRGNVLTEVVHSYEDDDSNTLTSSTTTYTYDSMGNMISSTCGDDTSTTTYDSSGRVILTNEGGECTRTVYDANGRVIQIIDPQDYDPDLERADGSYSATNVGLRYTYNNADQVVTETNRLGVVTTYTYHSNGECATESFDMYEFDYDQYGLLTDIWVARGENTAPYAHYVYNNGDGVSVTAPGVSASTETADTSVVASDPFADRCLNTAIEYGNGQTVYYSYNSSGLITSQSYKESPSSSAQVQYRYRYDADGALTTKVDIVNRRLYTYTDDTTSIYTLAYDADDSPVPGQLIYSYQSTVTDDDPATEADESSTTRVDTIGGRSFTSVYGSDKDNYNYGCFNFDRTVTSDDNSSSTVIKQDGRFVLMHSDVTRTDNSVTANVEYTFGENNYNYTYDDSGRLASYRIGDGMPYYDITEYYHYDSNGQLIRTDNTSTGTHTYSYDSRGNITSTKEYPYTRSDSLTSSSDVVTYDYDDTDPWCDKLAGIDDTIDEIVYDANGNPVRMDDMTLHWTNGRQLDHISYIDSDDQEQVFVSYTYDDAGLRTSKTFGDTTIYYIYIDGSLAAQYQLDSSGNVTEYATFMYSSDNELIGFIYDGCPIYYARNLMGDVTAIFDWDGVTLAEYRYDAWGNVDTSHSYEEYEMPQGVNSIGYRGYIYDREIGAYYLQSRYYSPTLNRFINSDLPQYAYEQKGDYAGLNLFAYCANDPVNYTDPTGKIKHKSKKYKVVVRLYKRIFSHIDVSIGGYLYTFGANNNNRIDTSKTKIRKANLMRANEKKYISSIYNKKIEKLTFYVSKKTYDKFKKFYAKIIKNSIKLPAISTVSLYDGEIYKINKGYFKNYNILFANCATFVYGAFYYAMPFKMTTLTAFYKAYPSSPTQVFHELKRLKKVNGM